MNETGKYDTLCRTFQRLTRPPLVVTAIFAQRKSISKMTLANYNVMKKNQRSVPAVGIQNRGKKVTQQLMPLYPASTLSLSLQQLG